MKTSSCMGRVGVMAVVLILGLGVCARGDYKQAYDVARQKLAAKDYPGVRAECDRALGLADLEADPRFNLLNLKAASYERESDWTAARAEYARIAEDPRVEKGWRLRVGLASVRALEREKRYEEAERYLKAMFDVAGLSSSDRVRIYEALARVATSMDESAVALEACEKGMAVPDLTPRDRNCMAQAAGRAGYPEKAMQWYRATIAMPELKDADKVLVYQGMADLHAGAHDAAQLRKVIETILALTGEPRDASRQLMALGHMRPHDTSDENTTFAWETLLRQEGLQARYREEAHEGLVRALLRSGRYGAAGEAVSTAAADTSLDASLRFRYAAVVAGIDAIERKAAVVAARIDRAAVELEIAPVDKLVGLNNAGRLLMESHEYRVVREIVAMADKMLEHEKRHYICRYVKEAPVGAGGWMLSPMLDDGKYREAGFLDYRQKDADRLITDVSVERGFDTEQEKKKAYYFDNTAFYMVYDPYGWHIFVLCGEQNTDAVRLDDGRASSLEMSFAPGTDDQAYRQWIITQADGDCKVFDWNSEHRHYRSIRDFMHTETVVRGNDWGTYIFFPWEVLYDRLPFDTGADWLFEVIRWSPAGGLSWSGGKVHETGKWGMVKWQAPPPAELLEIKHNLVRKAWSRYRQRRDDAVWHWRDSHIGDRVFYDEYLAPEIGRLDKYGEALKDPGDLSAAEVGWLFAEAVPAWMEVDYLVTDLRAKYLEKGLFLDQK